MELSQMDKPIIQITALLLLARECIEIILHDIKTQGFEILLAIALLLMVAYLFRKKK